MSVTNRGVAVRLKNCSNNLVLQQRVLPHEKTLLTGTNEPRIPLRTSLAGFSAIPRSKPCSFPTARIPLPSVLFTPIMQGEVEKVFFLKTASGSSVKNVPSFFTTPKYTNSCQRNIYLFIFYFFFIFFIIFFYSSYYFF